MSKEKKSPHTKQAEAILKMIEESEDLTPWLRPWVCIDTAPTRAKTAYQYTGNNGFFLMLAQWLYNWNCPFYGTFKEIKDHGGFLLKREDGGASFPIVIPKHSKKKDADGKYIPITNIVDGTPMLDDFGKPMFEQYFYWGYYAAFNIRHQVNWDKCSDEYKAWVEEYTHSILWRMCLEYEHALRSNFTVKEGLV